MQKKNKKIEIQGNEVRIQTVGLENFFSLTDLAKSQSTHTSAPDVVISNWLKNKDTLEFLQVWELSSNNGNFNNDEAQDILNEAGTNRFFISVKAWSEKTNAKGIYAKAGRYGGTYAHEDIALAFCSWLNPVFHLYFIKEFKRLKMDEAQRQGIAWDKDIKRFFSKVNYHILTDAVQEHLIPARIIQSKQEWIVYASEADLLNRALFGITAKDWKAKNPDLKGNMRDHASAEQLLVLANLENLNAEYIRLGLDKEERLQRLNEVAINQLQLLLQLPSTSKYLGDKN
jgi:hypothetical protein